MTIYNTTKNLKCTEDQRLVRFTFAKNMNKIVLIIPSLIVGVAIGWISHSSFIPENKVATSSQTSPQSIENTLSSDKEGIRPYFVSTGKTTYTDVVSHIGEPDETILPKSDDQFKECTWKHDGGIITLYFNSKGICKTKAFVR
jgi:hypothetical protein